MEKYFDFLDSFHQGMLWLSRNAFRTTLKEKRKTDSQASFVLLSS